MIGLLFFGTFFIILAGTYYYTRSIISSKKRISLVFGVPIATYCVIFSREIFLPIFTPVYCYINKNDVIDMHISPTNWEKMKHRARSINQVDSNNSIFASLAPPGDISIQNLNYHLFFTSEDLPNFVLYRHDENTLFGKDVYLYYDIEIGIPIISKTVYRSKYTDIMGLRKRLSCDNNIFYDLDDYLNKNYLSILK